MHRVLKQVHQWWARWNIRNHSITDNKQLITLVKTRVMPKLIRVASRLALLNINVTTRTGTMKWPPMMLKENQA